tara:strand:- start:407 stop:796 length:390 start_codon:yes stop_codon:yes gene_type:complete
MAKCKQCNRYISHNYIIYSADVRVCSNFCAINRLKDILSIDKNLEKPNLWSTLLSYKKKLYICEYCHTKITNIYTEPYNLDNSIYYCNYECKQKHWHNGYSDIYWRNGKVQPTKFRQTPSIIDSLNELS